MTNSDDLFTEDNDPIWKEPIAKPKAGKSRREQLRGPFYLCSESWADKAALACGHYLILALRLYQHWLRRGRPDAIAVTAAALAGSCHSRRGRLCVVTRLEADGLIQVVGRARGQAPEVRIIDPSQQP